VFAECEGKADTEAPGPDDGKVESRKRGSDGRTGNGRLGRAQSFDDTLPVPVLSQIPDVAVVFALPRRAAADLQAPPPIGRRSLAVARLSASVREG
jgi:hypothetical protein